MRSIYKIAPSLLSPTPMHLQQNYYKTKARPHNLLPLQAIATASLFITFLMNHC